MLFVSIQNEINMDLQVSSTAVGNRHILKGSTPRGSGFSDKLIMADPAEALQAVKRSLQEVFQCVVCNKTPGTSILQCKDGHIICKACAEGAEKIPRDQIQ